VVRDRGGAIAFYGEDPRPTGSDPYSGPDGFFQGQSPGDLLEQFPWDKLQALETDLTQSPTGSGGLLGSLLGGLL
jgi:hypothetical protein